MSPAEIAAANALAEAELARWMAAQQPAGKVVNPAPKPPAPPDPATVSRLAKTLEKKLGNAVQPPTTTPRPSMPLVAQPPARPRAGEVRARDRAADELKRIAFHARRAAEAAAPSNDSGTTEDPGEAEDQWCAIESALEAFLAFGGDPAEPAIDAALALCRATPPADPGPALRAALRLTVQPAHAPANTAAARALINNTPVVLIGGIPRPHVRAALEAGLNIPEVRWLDSRPHQSTSTFDAAIRRPDVRLVLLAIRWSSHSFAADIPAMCTRASKRCVRLPGGMGVTQVAHQIMQQLGRD
ncbi:MAG: hypothetical protein ACT4PL_06610 [Phycisphaerales bacterium]